MIQHLWSIRRQFYKYFTIGLSGVVLDLGTLYIFKNYFGWRPVAAVIVNQLIIILYIFNLNKYWAFKARGLTHRQFIRFSVLAVFNYIFTIGWMWFFNEILLFHYILVRLVNIILAVSWNFLIYKFWVYR